MHLILQGQMNIYEQLSRDRRLRKSRSEVAFALARADLRQGGGEREALRRP